MDIKNNSLIAFMFWILLGSSNVMAQSHTHENHQHHQTVIASPFDGKQEAGTLHCLLRGHVDRLVCPHSNLDSEQIPSIAKECDGKSSGSIPISSIFVSKFAETNTILQSDYSFGSKLTQSAFTPFDSFIDSLDPPPIKFL
jgi:hypothetical protein